jgi:ribosome-binding factor A
MMNQGSKRQQKFAKLIQKELGDIFQRDKRNILGKAFISVVDVQISPDLSFAKVYLSMMLVDDKKQVLDQINIRKSEIRKALGNSIAKQVRHIPELAFFIDEVEEKAMRLDQLIDSLVIPPATDEEE